MPNHSETMTKEERRIKFTPKKIANERWTDEVLEKYAVELHEWIRIPENWWLGDFAAEVLNTDRAMMAKLAKKNDTFRLAYKNAKQVQENKIVKSMMSGKFAQAGAIFTLKNVARWTDKTDVDVTSKGKPIPLFNFVDNK